MSKLLPPYGKSFEPVPRTGVRVALGRGAWEFAKKHPHPMMVLPDDEHPAVYRWPSDCRVALVHERGDYNDERLEALAECLLRAGASSVVALREALIDEPDCRVFFDKELRRAA